MRLTVLVLILLVSSNPLFSQEESKADTTLVDENKAEELKTKPFTKRQLKIQSKVYDPRVASRRSALIPGWGQIYNDTWWKVPILYTGFGVAVYFVYFNDGEFHEAKNLLANERAGNNDPNLVRIYSRAADTWRRNRDLVVLTMVGIYGLQIIEATVDAHMKGFNVDEDLSLNLKPKLGVISNGTPYLGVGITLPIGK